MERIPPYSAEQEKIFKDIVHVPNNYTVYLERGMNFIKFEKNGKKYRLSLREIKSDND